MDDKLSKAFGELSKSKNPVLIKDLKITAAQAKVLEDLDLVKLSIYVKENAKKKPLKPNAVKITPLGIQYLNNVQNLRNQQLIRTDIQFKELYRVISQTFSELEDIKKNLGSIVNISDKLVYDTIHKYSSSFKVAVEIPVVVNDLMLQTQTPESEIHKFLYKMYLESKISLQLGKATKGNPLIADDGSIFYYITIEK